MRLRIRLESCMYYFCIISVLFSLSACHSAKKSDVNAITKETSPPAWVKGEYRAEGKICAIGISGSTYFKGDRRLYAAENARKELARTISTKIESIMVEMRTGKGSWQDDATFSQASSWATDAVVENSEIIDYWEDDEGAVQQNSTFALCCMPRKLQSNQLAGKIMNLNRQIDNDKANIIAEEVVRGLEKEE